MTPPRSDALRQLPDADLISRVRGGESAAYGALWERHAAAAAEAAHAFSAWVDPEDVVAEAFASTLQAIRSGKGPTFAFRSYVLTVVRNVALAMRARATPAALDQAPEIEDPRFSEAALEEALDSQLVAKAFATLPLHWQRVLWYVEVEKRGASATAALMGGVSPGSVSALVYRAKEGLRRAWIAAHLAETVMGSECSWTVARLPALLRGSEKRNERNRILTHLASCDSCSRAYNEAVLAAQRIKGAPQ